MTFNKMTTMTTKNTVSLKQVLATSTSALTSPYNVNQYTDLMTLPITPEIVEKILPTILEDNRFLGEYIPVCGNVAVYKTSGGLDGTFPYGPPPPVTQNVGYGCVQPYNYNWPRITDAGEQRIIDGVIYRWDAYIENIQDNKNSAWSGLTSMLSASLDGLTWLRIGPDENFQNIDHSAIVLGFTIDRDNWFGKGKNIPIQLKQSQWYSSDTGRINSTYSYIADCPFHVTYEGKNYSIDDQKMYWTTDGKLLVVGQTNDNTVLPAQGGYVVVTWGTDTQTWSEPKIYTPDVWGLEASNIYRTECPSFIRLIDKYDETLWTYAFINGDDNFQNSGFSAWTCIKGDAISDPELMDQLLKSKFTPYAFGNMEYAMCITDRLQNDGTGGTPLGTNIGHLASGRYSWAVENQSYGYDAQLQFGTSGGSWWDTEVAGLLGLARFKPNTRFKETLSGFKEGTWTPQSAETPMVHSLTFDKPKKRLEFAIGAHYWAENVTITLTDAQGGTRIFETVTATAGYGPQSTDSAECTCIQMVLNEDDLKDMFVKENNVLTRLPLWKDDKLFFQIDNGWLMINGPRGRLGTNFGFGEGIVQIDVTATGVDAFHWSIRG
ncbi:hypothetical protein FAI40_03890 [Acetobacteraceae bacterium]|nr:hypothetical protein FAI40_03890 [Acetobacteraceae bacterium]